MHLKIDGEQTGNNNMPKAEISKEQNTKGFHTTKPLEYLKQQKGHPINGEKIMNHKRIFSASTIIDMERDDHTRGEGHQYLTEQRRQRPWNMAQNLL